MPTFLVTDKMNPALAARVEKAVHGGRASSPATTRRLIALTRVAIVVGIALVVYLVVVGRRRTEDDTEQTRAALLAEIETHAATLEPGDTDVVTRAESWLAGVAASEYAGDVVADEMRAPGALAAVLGRPALYVRGPIESFASYDHLAEAAASSKKDALLMCLARPPASRAEKVVLEEVKVSYFDGAGLEERTASVRRLHDAIAGRPFFQPAWAERVRNAETKQQLDKLRAELAKAPIEEAKLALKGEVLLVAIDEPGDGKGPTEIDGARSHFVRVAIVDLEAAKTLLSLRIHVDPSWISVEKRAMYAAGLDACALAFDIHEHLRRPG